MERVCGFTFEGTRNKAPDFDAKACWAELSPHTKWDSGGMSNGLIQDLATAVVHRFIGYNITGKKEANKISETELFLLWAMRAGVRVCSMTFFQNSLQEVALSRRGVPALGHFVTALARHFGVDPEPYNLHDIIYHEDKSTMRCINFAELKNADLIKTRTTAQPYMSRQAFTSYFQRLGQSVPTTDRPGSSRQPTDTDEHERMLMDYINTSHPNFIGGSKAVEMVLQVVKPSKIIVTNEKQKVTAVWFSGG
ncbi:dynamin related protein [Striga asiatica]|uniref:Dynamin related protein n=1 Tax=Striga asiatica TaxID=4170 RepID=A0A5A7PUU9_STRAF|nr:dynamin related protein [Striga asiatica]